MMNTTTMMIILFEWANSLHRLTVPPLIHTKAYMGRKSWEECFFFLFYTGGYNFFWGNHSQNHHARSKVTREVKGRIFFWGPIPDNACTNARESRLINLCTSRVCVHASTVPMGAGGFRSQSSLHRAHRERERER
jgi:hypothetical protein